VRAPAILPYPQAVEGMTMSFSAANGLFGIATRQEARTLFESAPLFAAFQCRERLVWDCYEMKAMQIGSTLIAGFSAANGLFGIATRR
jgi:hypothetical protein